jgi:glycosyltransferase involved in cell wall biosynthesis
MIAEKWRDQLDPGGKHAAMKKQCFDMATAIPCISSSTRDDLLELYPYLESKVSVIPLSGELKINHSIKKLAPTSVDCTPYLLYVGARKSYKNFARLLLAFARVVPRFQNLLLKVAGAPFTSEESELLQALGISNQVIIYPDITDSELYDLYRDAISFVYPSLYEGFGLPLLEAMSLGTPVITSNTSSMPEVAGNAALLFNPESIESITDAIIEIVARPDLREDLRRKGYQQSLRFSWDKTCDQYIELYHKSIQHRP